MPTLGIESIGVPVPLSNVSLFSQVLSSLLVTKEVVVRHRQKSESEPREKSKKAPYYVVFTRRAVLVPVPYDMVSLSHHPPAPSQPTARPHYQHISCAV